jgi:hypothetical protein
MPITFRRILNLAILGVVTTLAARAQAAGLVISAPNLSAAPGSSGATVNPGDIFGVANVSYTVDAGATPGPRTLTIESLGAGTSLSDQNGIVPAFTASNGILTVAVPEPAFCGLPALGAIDLFARRRIAR